MSQWLHMVRGHAVWPSLEALGQALDLAVGREDVPPDALDTIQRVRTVLAFSGRRLAGVDPALLLPSSLDNINNAVQAAASECQAFASNGNTGHLDNANNHASTILSHLTTVLALSTPEELTGLSEAAASYRTAMERSAEAGKTAVTELKSSAEQVKVRLDELSSEMAAERSRLTTLTSDFQSQFSSAQDTRAREFSDQQATRLKEFSDGQSSRQAKFDETLAASVQRLNEQDAEFTRQREAAKKQADADLEKLDAEFRTQATAILDQIESHKRDVEKLVGVIGNLGVTSGYLTTANYARRQTIIWQCVTVLAFVGLIGFAFFAFLPALNNDFSWERFAGRVVLSLAVGAFAAYAAAQADRYMETERRNRKAALELEAIGPFLAPLPEDKQQQFRLELGARTFGREERPLGRRGDKSPATLVDVLLSSKEFNKVVTEIVAKVTRQTP